MPSHASTSTTTCDEDRAPWFVTVTWMAFLALMIGYVVVYYAPGLRMWLELPPP
ncbi:MAG: hypothetical protein IT379_28670 [Deltaproteobacteria bacterium]|nr:hypothetical protein [Deltaproteobacteria bacterium]